MGRQFRLTNFLPRNSRLLSSFSRPAVCVFFLLLYYLFRSPGVRLISPAATLSHPSFSAKSSPTVAQKTGGITALCLCTTSFTGFCYSVCKRLSPSDGSLILHLRSCLTTLYSAIQYSDLFLNIINHPAANILPHVSQSKTKII